MNDPHTGMETMELSHEPTPLREGGTNTVPVWATQHAARDEHRYMTKGFELSEEEIDRIREAFWDRPGYRDYDPRT